MCPIDRMFVMGQCSPTCSACCAIAAVFTTFFWDATMKRHLAPNPISRGTFAHRSVWLLAACAALSACGGGGGGSDPEIAPAPPPAPTPAPAAPTPSQPAVKLEGVVVINQTVSNATVCLDLNQNLLCDAGEPVSSVTGVDGRYTIHHQPADEAATAVAARAGVVALLTPQSVDAAAPNATVTTKPITLAAPAGKTGQINPLTTLLQLAIKNGMTVQEAEVAVGRQLQADVSSLYDYQGEALNPVTGLAGDVRASAGVTAFMLELGISPFTPFPDQTSSALTSLSYLNYTSADQYEYRMRGSDGVRQADGALHQFETRFGKNAGKELASADLYRSATLTQKGWTRCDNTVPRLVTEGIPSRTIVCNDSTRFVSFSKSFHDISDVPMAEVVAAMQKGDDTLNSHGLRVDATTVVDLKELGDARFPAGSVLRFAVSVQNDSSPAFINHLVADRFGYPSIAQMIKARPAGGVNLASAAATTVGGMGTLDRDHLLRVAFVDDKTAQFYACKSTAPDYRDLGACVVHSQSAFAIKTQNGVPLLSFANFPGITDQNGTTRGYTEYDGVVYPYRQPPAFRSVGDAVTQNARFNDVASKALLSVLKLN